MLSAPADQSTLDASTVAPSVESSDAGRQVGKRRLQQNVQTMDPFEVSLLQELDPLVAAQTAQVGQGASNKAQPDQCDKFATFIAEALRNMSPKDRE